MEPFYKDNLRTLYQKDSRDMSELDNESIDLLATDPPYGISFMGKDWDRALPDKQIWRECLRVLKPGAFAFIMSIPRADCLSRMIISLEDAGFRVDFSPIFWTYATGFPKAQNIGKAVDKRLGAEREVVGKRTSAYGTEPVSGEVKSRSDGKGGTGLWQGGEPKEVSLTGEPATSQAKALDGSYGGFQPKPAVEVIIVAMKPMSEKTFVDQALKNGKGITWLDDCRMPYESDGVKETRWMSQKSKDAFNRDDNWQPKNGRTISSGRFPANLLVSDDVLNDGRVTKSRAVEVNNEPTNADVQVYGWAKSPQLYKTGAHYGDSGSFSRYFDLDKWAQTLPFLIVPKASKSEKNKGIGAAVPRTRHGSTPRKNEAVNKSPNSHPTVKPVKLMAYLITLGSREGDVVLDNFAGSGTTGVAAALLGRRCIMYEKEDCNIAADRCRQGALEF